MFLFLICFGILDAIVGLFIYNGSTESDAPKSNARIGAMFLSFLLLTSSALMIGQGMRIIPGNVSTYFSTFVK
jgi:hypothetical protein